MGAWEWRLTLRCFWGTRSAVERNANLYSLSNKVPSLIFGWSTEVRNDAFARKIDTEVPRVTPLPLFMDLYVWRLTLKCLYMDLYGGRRWSSFIWIYMELGWHWSAVIWIYNEVEYCTSAQRYACSFGSLSLISTLSIDRSIDSTLDTDLGLHHFYDDAGWVKDVGYAIIAFFLSLICWTHLACHASSASSSTASWLGSIQLPCWEMHRCRGFVVEIVGRSALA